MALSMDSDAPCPELEAMHVLERREKALATAHAGLDVSLADNANLPAIVMLEVEYAHAVATAQLTWIRSTLDDLRSSRLTWSHEELAELAAREWPENP
jgi:acyl-CoA thioesterase FadM